MRHPLAVLALLVFAGLAGFPTIASAQSATGRRWVVEFHGGGSFENKPSDGSTSLPPAGAAFTTSAGRPSRRASSWYFGDGAQLMNEVLASFVASPATGRITSLNAVLNKPGASRGPGASLGVRVLAEITPRFAAEFAVDGALSRLTLTDSFLAGVEASRTSFIGAWNAQTGLVRTGGGVVFTNSNVTSTAAITDKQGRQVFMTGALSVNLKTRGRVIPYATVGAGIVSNVGESPSVTLTGNYRFTSLYVAASGTFQVDETDTVTVSAGPSSTRAFVTVFGGGVRIDRSPRSGVRADVRVYVSKNAVDMLIDAAPSVATSSPAGYIASTLTPSIQFSSNPSTGHTSNLTGPAVSGFTAFNSSGLSMRVSISGSYFIRF